MASRAARSVFSYRPTDPAAANAKPVLIACGENDEIVGADHARAYFERIGGPKDLFVMPGGGHQLMLFETEVYSRVVDSWIRERVLARGALVDRAARRRGAGILRLPAPRAAQ